MNFVRPFSLARLSIHSPSTAPTLLPDLHKAPKFASVLEVVPKGLEQTLPKLGRAEFRSEVLDKRTKSVGAEVHRVRDDEIAAPDFDVERREPMTKRGFLRG